MNSVYKSITHTLASIITLWLPVIISSNPIFQMSLGTILMLIVNYLISHFIPTTTGASARQDIVS